MRLLLLEDDPILGSGLQGFLSADGHTVDWHQRLATLASARNEPFDALLVDWQLPDGSGLDWVRSLRARGDTTPVLVMTARDLVSDRIKGLDSGADDYLVKPFDPDELLARLRAVCRRSAGTAHALLQCGDVTLDLTAREARVHGVRADLTAREWALTEALARRAGRIVGKADLEALVMGMDADVSSNTLEVHIYGIRRKLGRHFIETVRGLGYRVSR